jgi:hypothetical protein
VKPENPREASRVNGMTPNQQEMVSPEESQTTVSEQPQEEAMEDVTGRPEQVFEEQTMEDGTSSHPPQ